MEKIESKRTNKYKINIDQTLTFLIILNMQINFWFASTYITNINYLEYFRAFTLIFSCICLIFKWYYQKISKLHSLILLLILIMIISITYVSKGMTLFKSFLFLLAVKGVEFKKVGKYMLFSNLIIIISLILLISLGVIENNYGFKLNGDKFFTLGFTNPNTLAMILSTIYFLFNILIVNRKKIEFILFNILYIFIVYYITKSRSALVSTIVFFILFYLEDYIYTLLYKKSTLLKITSYILFPMCSLISYFFATSYGSNNFVTSLNRIFSWRFSLWHVYSMNYNIELFGNNIDPTQMVTLDNGYLVLIYRYGILSWLLYLILFTATIKYIFQNNDTKAWILLIVFSVYMLTEGFTMMINVNLILLFSFCLFWSFNFEKNKKSIHKNIWGDLL